VARRRPAGARLRRQRLQAHQPHQPAHPIAADPDAVAPQRFDHAPRAAERRLQIERVEPAHQCQILGPGPGHRPISAGPRDTRKRALAAHRNGSVPAVDRGQTVRAAHLPDLLAKKSRSTVSWPIFALGCVRVS
jgi:hypothetical protein